MLKKQIQRKRRHARVRAKVQGTKERPRLSVFRSNQHIYTQLINDKTGKVLAAVSDLKLKGGSRAIASLPPKEKKSGVELAKAVGKALAKAAKEQGVSKIVFDRGGYKYHGTVRALAEAAREQGLKF